MARSTGPGRTRCSPPPALLAARYGFAFQDFERHILKCREDGKITPEESEKLALQLDYLCASFANRRLKFWLFAAVLAALVASAAFVAFGVASVNRHQNVKTPLDFQVLQRGLSPSRL